MVDLGEIWTIYFSVRSYLTDQRCLLWNMQIVYNLNLEMRLWQIDISFTKARSSNTAAAQSCVITFWETSNRHDNKVDKGVNVGIEVFFLQPNKVTSCGLGVQCSAYCAILTLLVCWGILKLFYIHRSTLLILVKSFRSLKSAATLSCQNSWAGWILDSWTIDNKIESHCRWIFGC